MDDYFHGEEPSLLPLNDESSLLPSGNEPKHDDIKAWGNYRDQQSTTSANATPHVDAETPEENGTPGLADEDDSTPKPPSQNKSMVSAFAKKAMGADGTNFFTLKAYEDELKKARSDIFGLKLRIRLLEERQGLVQKPDDAENVYRINLDLRVEKEVLKQQVEEKVAQLQEAYFAVDQLERERESERDDLLSQIEGLRHQGGDRQQARPDSIRVEDQSLLLEAFGSMNLGAHPADGADRVDNESSYRKRIDQLEADLSIERDHVRDLELKFEAVADENDQLKSQVAGLEGIRFDALKERGDATGQGEQRLAVLEDENKQLCDELAEKEASARDHQTRANLHVAEIAVLQKKIGDIEGELAAKAEELRLRETDDSESRRSVDELEQVVAHHTDRLARLESERDHYKNLHENAGEGGGQDVAVYKEKIERLEANLAEDKATVKDHQAYVNLKLAEIAALHKKVAGMEAQLATKSAALEESEENVKKAQLCVSGLTGVTVSQKEELARTEAEYLRYKAMFDRLSEEYETCKAKVRRYRADAKNRDSSLTDGKSGSDARIKCLEKELEAAKKAFARKGAEEALRKAGKVYNDRLKKIDSGHQSIVALMKKRLEELADCLQRILTNGQLDLSSTLNNESVRDILEASLNESRRLSVSLSQSFFGHHEDVSELQLEIRPVELSVEDIGLDPVANEYEELVDDLKRQLEDERARVGQLEAATKVQADVEALESKLADMAKGKEQSERLVEAYELQICELRARVDQGKNEGKLALAEKNAIVEDLRVKCGQAKEKSRKLEEELSALRRNSRNAKELAGLRSEVAKLQTENREVVDVKAMLEEELEGEKKIRDDLGRKVKEQEGLLARVRDQLDEANQTNFDNNEEMATLRKQLAEAEERLAKFRERQERVDKALRHQLAKTHVVLKKTKANLDTVPDGAHK